MGKLGTLQHLPPTLTHLSLQGISSFELPTTPTTTTTPTTPTIPTIPTTPTPTPPAPTLHFPPNLTYLLLSGAHFTQNNLTNCLPQGLLTLIIDFDFTNDTSDGYGFATFDCSGLPSTLTCLAFQAGDRPYKDINGDPLSGPLELVGTLPSSVVELVLSEEDHIHRCHTNFGGRVGVGLGKIAFQPSLLPKDCSVRLEGEDYFKGL
jgi:hypothetical protein